MDSGGKADLFGGRKRMTGAWRTWKQSASKTEKKIREFSEFEPRIEIRTAESACLATKDMTEEREGRIEGINGKRAEATRENPGASSNGPVRTEITAGKP